MWPFIKFFLFFLEPETAHTITFLLLKALVKIPGIKGLLKHKFKIASQKPIRLFGLEFKNPVGLAAGLDKNGQYISELALLGFSHIEIGTVTARPQKGNPRPRLFRMPKDKALINRMGFNNDGALEVARRLNFFTKPIDLILGINIGKNKETSNEEAFLDYKICFEALYPFADYFTINISSPNTPGLRGLQDKGPLRNLLKEISDLNKAQVKLKPILLKIAPDLNHDQLAEIKELCLEYAIAGIIMGNTSIGRENLKTLPDRIDKIGPGGLSGEPIRQQSLEKLKSLIELPGNMDIIGVGGILEVQAAQEKLNAGAALIQIYTGLIYEGPGFVKRLVRDLKY